jgi:hypothetical protein
MRGLREFAREVRPMYQPSNKLGVAWLELGELLLKENPNDESMRRAALYLYTLATNGLEVEQLPDMPLHCTLIPDAELTLARLALVPRTTRQLLPVAVFQCMIGR